MRTQSSTNLENEDYLAFYKRSIPESWTIPRHIRYLCEVAQKVVDGEWQRVAISVPPGHAKSSTITHRLPVYWGLRNPMDGIVTTGYSQSFAERQLSRPSRNIAREMGVIGKMATALHQWDFNNDAFYMARGVGSPPTGVNPISLLVCDDPISNRKDAESEVMRADIWAWWQGSIVQRFWPRTRAFVISTRWHESDLIGNLMRETPEGWTFINLPAIAEENDPLGREVGEALWPEQKPIDFLERVRREMGEWEFGALYQGRPSPREGAMFQVGKLNYADNPPPEGFKRVVQAWDLAATQGAGSYTVGVTMGADVLGQPWIIDVVRGRWDAAEVRRRILQAANDQRPHLIRVPQDPGQAGKFQVTTLATLLAGRNIKIVPPTGSKETRAEPFAAQCNAGTVHVLRRFWTSDLVEELRTFPMGTHNDQVDAASDAYAELAKPARAWIFK